MHVFFNYSIIIVLAMRGLPLRGRSLGMPNLKFWKSDHNWRRSVFCKTNEIGNATAIQSSVRGMEWHISISYDNLSLTDVQPNRSVINNWNQTWLIDFTSKNYPYAYRHQFIGNIFWNNQHDQGLNLIFWVSQPIILFLGCKTITQLWRWSRAVWRSWCLSIVSKPQGRVRC